MPPFKYAVSDPMFWLSEEAILELFMQAGAIRTGHFVYNSGRHGGVYVNKRVFEHSDSDGEALAVLAHEIAHRLVEFEPTIIVSPEHGAITLGGMVADVLACIMGREVPFVPIRKGEGKSFSIDNEHLELFARGPVAMVEDILNSGGSGERASLVIPTTAEILAIASLWNRGGVVAESFSRIPRVISLVNQQFGSYAATEDDPCLLCEHGPTVNTELGHGAEFLAARK